MHLDKIKQLWLYQLPTRKELVARPRTSFLHAVQVSVNDYKYMAPGKCGSGGGLVGDESGLKYAKIEGKDGGFIPRVFLGLPDKESTLKQPKKNKQSFKRVLKAVLFETSLAKKIKKTKVLQKLHQSKKNRSGKVEKKNSYQVKNNPTNSIYLEVPRKVDGTNTSQSSSRSISRSSSYSSISKSLVKTKPSNLAQPKQKQDNYSQDIGKGDQSNDIGIYVIVVSLLSLAFCGKTSAIIFTVGCLYCVPRLIHKSKRSIN